jgi:PIN domain nuclease of toxin-antitoxin system
MRLLLDTHVLLWAAGKPEKLSRKARKMLDDPDCSLVFSAVSLWEIAVKHALGREDFRADVRLLRRGLLDNGYEELALTSEHAIALDTLPPLHKDPFDRMLLAQSHVEGIMLVTADALVAQYPGAVQKI